MTTSLVSFADVGKTYRSLHGIDYVAGEHFSAEIASGEFFCLLGPSGCGKTTVLKLLTSTASRARRSASPATPAARCSGWP